MSLESLLLQRSYKLISTVCQDRYIHMPFKILLYVIGTVGETVLHVAALYNSKEAAIILLNTFPFLMDEPIDCEMYKGKLLYSLIKPLQDALVLQ